MNHSLRATDIHARISWPTVLEQLGIAAAFLRNRHGPCPACGGNDRYRFDNKRGRGDFFCNGCGAGDGFALLQRVHGWTFAETRRRVMDVAGIKGEVGTTVTAAAAATTPAITKAAVPTARVRAILRSACAIADCKDAIDYLSSRRLWPLPAGCTLRASVAVDYFEGGHLVGRFPALIAPVRDIHGELVTVHVTYLQHGRKLADHEARKMLSPLTGRTGCAVRLVEVKGDTLGIAEGIETAISASMHDSVPVWAALNASLMSRFQPPPGVARLRIYADRDEAGLLAAAQLMQRLQAHSVRFDLCTPTPPAKDWNDVLVSTTHA